MNKKLGLGIVALVGVGIAAVCYFKSRADKKDKKQTEIEEALEAMEKDIAEMESLFSDEDNEIADVKYCKCLYGEDTEDACGCDDTCCDVKDEVPVEVAEVAEVAEPIKTKKSKKTKDKEAK